jgi:anaerobic selenocysteine-containing dehydrogenase
MANIDRRDFLRLVGAGGVGAGAGFMLAEAIKHPVEYLIPYPVAPEEASSGIATWYNTVCGMCPAGCGISVRTLDGRAKKIEGNPAHPVSQGRLCALGQAGLQALYNPDRLTGPVTLGGARGSGSFVRTTWDEGLAALTTRLRALRESGQGERVCLLTQGARGHLAILLERFMEGLGSSRLLHYDFTHPHTLYAATKILFGEQNLPYYDLGNARYLLSFGADYLGNWLSPVHHALGYGRGRQGRPDARIHCVQIEPRMSLSGAAADEWIPAQPGTEGVLALAIAHRLVEAGVYTGADRGAWAAMLEAYAPAVVTAQTGVGAETIERLADAFAAAQPGLAIGGGAMANHSNGVAALVAVNALNYLVGNIGREGGVIFNPDPPFGRSVEPRARQAAYRTMLELAEDARQGRIDVLIVWNSNPVFGLPAASGFSEALAKIPLIASLSSFMDETTALADLILPSHTYLESWGDDTPEPGVGFSVGAVSQPVVSPLYDTRAIGDTVLELGRSIGLGEKLPWPGMEDYLKASWRDIHAGASQPGKAESFEEFWTALVRAGVWGQDKRRAAASVVVGPSVVSGIGVAAPEFSGSSDEYPFILHPYPSNAFRDGRGANLPWMQELPDPITSVVYGSWVELNPVTATQLGLEEGDLVEVQSTGGTIKAPVCIFPAIGPGVVAMPIGQGHGEYGRYARNRGVNPIEILAPVTEPTTGVLAWGATRVRLVPTGRRVRLLRTGGASRQLGRGIVKTTADGTGGGLRAGLRGIPIVVEGT